MHHNNSKLSLFIITIIFLFICLSTNAENKDSDKKPDQSKNEPGSEKGNLLAEIPYYLEIFETDKKIEIKINAFYFINDITVNILNGFGLL
jgi:hypothetical protein